MMLLFGSMSYYSSHLPHIGPITEQKGANSWQYEWFSGSKAHTITAAHG